MISKNLRIFTIATFSLLIIFGIIIFIWFSFPMPVRSVFDGMYSNDVLLWIIKKPVSLTGTVYKVSDDKIYIFNGNLKSYINRSNIKKISYKGNDMEFKGNLKIDDAVFIKIKYQLFIPQYEIFISNT